MTKLALGILLWSFTHLIPGLFAGARSKLVGRLGENAYKGLFLLLTVLAIYLVISGWKAAVPGTVYLPPDWGRHVAALLVLAGFILFFPHSRARRRGPATPRHAPVTARSRG